MFWWEHEYLIHLYMCCKKWLAVLTTARVVTLVADKLKRKWLWEVIVVCSGPGKEAICLGQLPLGLLDGISLYTAKINSDNLRGHYNYTSNDWTFHCNNTTSTFLTDVQWLLSAGWNCKLVLPSFLCGCLMHLASDTITIVVCNHSNC